MKRLLLLSVFILSSLASALPAGAAIYVRIGPPPVRIEHAPPPPGPGYVWQGGEWRWDGARYVWVPGRYVRHVAGHWVPAHWVRRPGGWVRVEGHWA